MGEQHRSKKGRPRAHDMYHAGQRAHGRVVGFNKNVEHMRGVMPIGNGVHRGGLHFWEECMGMCKKCHTV